jgi:hypothetical protein
MFPSTVVDYGGPETRRLGDVLVRGKQYMATQEGFEWHGAGDTYVEHYLYHLLGDPTMQMWSDPPVRFDPNRFKGIIKDIRDLRVPQPGDPPFYVHFELNSELALGTLVTLFNGDAAVGRGTVGANGQVDIIPDAPFDDQDRITFSLQQDGALPAQGQAENPPKPQQATSLSLDTKGSPAQTGGGDFIGSLSPAFAGAPVRIVYTRTTAPGSTTTQTVTTAANGGFTDHFDFSNQYPSHWKVQAFFDGDGDHAASSSNTVEFDIGD